MRIDQRTRGPLVSADMADGENSDGTRRLRTVLRTLCSMIRDGTLQCIIDGSAGDATTAITHAMCAYIDVAL